MQYRKDRYGNSLSILGFGCMRFTASGGKINVEKASEEVLAAIDAGVNYFDTAYAYPGNEAALGEILEKNGVRDRVNIATKLPHYLLKTPDSAEKYFTEELRRLRTDHVDYYLMHMLTDVKTWERLKGLGVDRWLAEKKRNGQIRQAGFSYHGNSDVFMKLLDAYDWDFCQIQYNYLDEHSQAGVTGLRRAAEKGLPVIIMEPLRGGRLARLPQEAEKLLSAYPEKRSAAEWGLRWLWNQKEVTCVLSGMNSLAMVEENCRVASNVSIGEFGEAENRLLNDVKAVLNRKMKVGCTGCRYCMPCPKGVDIPGTFAVYNRYYTESRFAALKEYFMCTALRRDSTSPAQCVQCGKCESRCPQAIPIREQLKKARRTLGGPAVELIGRVTKAFMKY